jgi:hypothetical protein
MLMKSPITIKGIDGKETKIEYKAKNAAIWMSNSKFVIPKILCFPNMHGDFLLGNNFISNYLSMQIYHKFVALTLKKELVNIPILEQHKHKCISDFAPTKRGECHIHTITITTLDSSHWIYKILEENFSENPLKQWSKSPQLCSLKLKDHNVIINVKPIDKC